MKATILSALVYAFVSLEAYAGNIGVDPTSGTAGLVSGYGGLTLGWEFQVSASQGIVVDGLGFWDDGANGFLFGQTFDVGLWDPTTGALLRESVITSGSSLKSSLDSAGAWRVNAVAPLYLAPGSYRVGALMPASGANAIISDPATFQAAQGINFVGFLRQIGSATLAMPDIGPPYLGAAWFGPTFTFSSGALRPTGSIVAPGTYSSRFGMGGLNTLVRNSTAPRTYQMQFSAAALAGLPIGSRITELRFRLATNVVTFPSSTVTWANYEVTLAQAAKPMSTMSPNFADNMLAPVLVRSGALSIGANTFTTAPELNPFASFLVLDTPYTYQGGDLVMLFRHPGSDSTSTAFLDALSATTAGYGTDFRAFSTNSYTAPNGFSAAVTIPQIVFAYSPRQTLSGNGTNVVLVATGGPPGGSYHLLASGNLTLPASQWTAIASGQFDGSGSFRFTNAITAGSPAQFFRIAMP